MRFLFSVQLLLSLHVTDGNPRPGTDELRQITVELLSWKLRGSRNAPFRMSRIFLQGYAQYLCTLYRIFVIEPVFILRAKQLQGIDDSP